MRILSRNFFSFGCSITKLACVARARVVAAFVTVGSVDACLSLLPAAALTVAKGCLLALPAG